MLLLLILLALVGAGINYNFSAFLLSATVLFCYNFF